MAVIITTKGYENDVNEVREIVNEFSEDTEIDDVLYYATSEWGFRIPHEADRKLWNEIIDEGWGGLDDADYFKYDKPYVFDDKWVCLDSDGHFSSLQEVINTCKFTIKMLTKVKNMNGGQY